MKKNVHITIHNKTTMLHVKAYEYKCLNIECDVLTFNAELEFSKRYQTMTDTLIYLIFAFQYF